MSAESVSDFAEAVRQFELIDPGRSNEFERVAETHSDVRAAAKEMIQRGLVTTWQAQTVLKGRGKELVFGSYVLMDQLGEGGMGRVYKARHRMMGRVVALKVIRRERMQNPQSVKRFHREIQAAAQLTHPNVVLAYDADQAGDTISSQWSLSKAWTSAGWCENAVPSRSRKRAITSDRRRSACNTLTSEASFTATSNHPIFF